MTTIKGNKMTLQQIREKMGRRWAVKYHGNIGNRIMFISAQFNDHKKIGSFFFSIDGSSPKGYAIYIPGQKIINFYDLCGERYNSFECISVPELLDERGLFPREDFQTMEFVGDYEPFQRKMDKLLAGR